MNPTFAFRLYLGLRDQEGAPVSAVTRAEFLAHVATILPGFTLFEATGFFEGIAEPSMVLEYVTLDPRDSSLGFMVDIARAWNRTANQASSLLIRSRADVEFIETR
jgi:hypothetical protein